MLLLGNGPIQAEHPGLAQQMVLVSRVHTGAATIVKVITVLTDVDSGFHANITEQFSWATLTPPRLV